MGPIIHRIDVDLYQVVLSPPIDGFDDFIAAWLVTGPDAVFVVDVGPAATADQLIDALGRIGIDRLDYICLTHIHIDHAGAVGHLRGRFPEAKVVCHPKAAPHLIDPERLWQGTVKTLGDTGRAYGRMRPVNPSAIADESALAAAPFRLLDTPGHSPHHFAVAADGRLFAGEAGGVYLPLPSGDLYLRPATPPRFFLETSLASIDTLLTIHPTTICYGHFGHRHDGAAMLTRHREQLLRWEKVLAAETARGKKKDAAADVDSWLALLLAQDPLLAAFGQLPPAAQQRERGFLRNSIKGFAGYLAQREAGD